MTSWLDQQMVSGVPNSYLLIGVGAVILIAALGARARDVDVRKLAVGWLIYGFVIGAMLTALFWNWPILTKTDRYIDTVFVLIVIALPWIPRRMIL